MRRRPETSPHRCSGIFCAVNPIPTPTLPLKGREVWDPTSPLKGREVWDPTFSLEGEGGLGSDLLP